MHVLFVQPQPCIRALKYAEGRNHIEMVNLLKDVEQLNTELIEAVKADDVQLVETLLKKGTMYPALTTS